MVTKKLFLFLIPCLLVFSVSEAQDGQKLDSLRFTPYWFSDLESASTSPGQVHYLDLSLNKFVEFPKEVLEFQNLKRLDLSYNKLVEIPSEITRLEKLEYLDLSGNNFNKLPPVLLEMNHLKEISLKEHLMKEEDLKILRDSLKNTLVVVY